MQIAPETAGRERAIARCVKDGQTQITKAFLISEQNARD